MTTDELIERWKNQILDMIDNGAVDVIEASELAAEMQKYLDERWRLSK